MKLNAAFTFHLFRNHTTDMTDVKSVALLDTTRVRSRQNFVVVDKSPTYSLRLVCRVVVRLVVEYRRSSTDVYLRIILNGAPGIGFSIFLAAGFV